MNSGPGMTVSLQKAIAILSVLLGVSSARAEYSWLIADGNSLNNGELLWLSFVTGERFPIGEGVSDPASLAQFLDLSSVGIRQVEGYARQDRGLSVRQAMTGPGGHVVGCATTRELIRMPADEFDAYLRRERADKALAIVAGRGSPAEQGDVWEAYTKYAKTIVEVHPARADDCCYLSPLGHRLEIIPLSNPCHWRAGDAVRVEVRLDGYPWADIPVAAGHDGLEHQTCEAETRTDASGIADITLNRAGHWFIRAHLIRPTDGFARPKWESFWATLTFRVAGAGDVSDTLRALRAARRSLEPWLAAGYLATRKVVGEVGREAIETFPRASALQSAVTAAPSEGVIPQTALSNSNEGRRRLRDRAAGEADGAKSSPLAAR